jgi:flagellar motility protein MotE (MotC chaperone)
MKDRSLSAILAEMTPVDAKVLTERLAGRNTAADQARDAMNAASVPPVAAAGAKPPQTAAAPPASADGKG